MTTPTIYVAQFGGIWALTPAQWAEVVASGLAGEGYELSQYRQLERRPYFILPNIDGRGFWISHTSHKLYQPLDWTDYDWRAAAADIARR